MIIKRMKSCILQTLLFWIFQALLMPASQAQNTTVFSVTDISSTAVTQRINVGVSALLSEFHKAFSENRTPSLNKINGLSSDGKKAILSMWETTPFRCEKNEINERGLSTPSGWQVRNIPIFLKGMPPNKAYKEIAINFDKNGNIDDIYFTLEKHIYNEIMNSEENEVTDLNRRALILDFLENFRTAYNRKDIDLISKMYSEDALIITGKVVKQTKTTDNTLRNSGFTKDQIEYQVKTKQEYIKSLQNVFRNNAKLDIVFDNIDVSRHPKYDEIYGVTLKQGWNATNYSDVGWLFLMIDFKDGKNMEIHLRTWQPEKVNGKSLSEDDVFHLGKFIIKK